MTFPEYDYDEDLDDGWLGPVPPGWPTFGTSISFGGDGRDMDRTPHDVDGLVALVNRLRARVATAEKVCAHVTVASGRRDLDTLASLLGEWREAVMLRD